MLKFNESYHYFKALSNIAIVYASLQYQDRAYEILQNAILKVKNHLFSFESDLSDILSAITSASINLHDKTKTYVILKQAFSYTQNISYEIAQSKALSNIATVYASLDDKGKAYALLKQALSHTKNIDNNLDQFEVFSKIATIYAAIHDNNKAHDFL